MGTMQNTIKQKGYVCYAEGCDKFSGKILTLDDCEDCGGRNCSHNKARYGSIGSNGKHQKLLACAACKEVYYCSRECQIKDWKARHKLECNGNDKPSNEETAPTDYDDGYEDLEAVD